MWRSSSNESASGRSHQSCMRCPNITPMRRASWMRCREGSRPATEIRPDDGTRMPVSIFTVVDFPAPFGPM